jgi:hypothetical protein
MAQSRQLSIDQAKEIILFRNGRGSQVEFPGNKRSCRAYASSFPAAPSGTILAKFAGGWYSLLVNCPSFTVFKPLKKRLLT